MPSTEPLEFTKNDIMWVKSNVYGAACALIVEEIELKKRLICFGCALEELRVTVKNMDNWMATPQPSPLGLLLRTNGLPPGSSG